MSIRPAAWSRRRVLHSAVAVAVPSISAAVAHAQAAPPAPADWPCFRGPNRNGVVREKLTLLRGGPKPIWTAKVAGGNASAVVAGGRLYVFGAGRDNLACLDARTGRRLWSQSIETHGGNTTPVVENGRVYVVSGVARISGERPDAQPVPIAYCCDATTGNVRWRRELTESTGERVYGLAGSPVVWEDLLLINGGNGAALKLGTGEIAWHHPGFPGLATPVVFTWQAKACVALFSGDRLITREARTGRELWQIPWKTVTGVNACDPIIMGTRVFLCSDYGLGRAMYDFSSGQPRLLWQFGAGQGSRFSSGFANGGQLYCFYQRFFACLDPATGEPRWQEEGGMSALLLGDTLVRVRETGEIMFGRLSAEKHEPLASADAGVRELKSIPAYWDGKLYLRSEGGQIACLQIAA